MKMEETEEVKGMTVETVEAKGTVRNVGKIPEEMVEGNLWELSLGKQRIPVGKTFLPETILGGIMIPGEVSSGKSRETIGCLDRIFGMLGMLCASSRRFRVSLLELEEWLWPDSSTRNWLFRQLP
jgi:hypothetical protein